MSKLEKSLEDEMVRAAVDARTRAYAPYSEFQVGACVLVTNDADEVRLFEGCNVENASYGLCICAERTAISTAVAAGFRQLIAVVVATGSSPPSPPCGMCRQVIAEFASPLTVKDGALIVCVNPAGERVRSTSVRMLPGSFNKALLDKGRTKGVTKAPAKKRAAKKRAP